MLLIAAALALSIPAILYGGTYLYAYFIVWLVIGRGTNEKAMQVMRQIVEL